MVLCVGSAAVKSTVIHLGYWYRLLAQSPRFQPTNDGVLRGMRLPHMFIHWIFSLRMGIGIEGEDRCE